MADVVKVTNDGLGLTTGLFNASGIQWIAHGTGATASASTTDTDLEAEVDSRVSGTQSIQTTTVTDDTYRVVGQISATASRSIEEVGIFDQESTTGDTLYLRGTFDPINLNDGDSIEYTIDTVHSDGSA